MAKELISQLSNEYQALTYKFDANKQKILDYLSDKSIPLEERWTSLCLLPESFHVNGYWSGSDLGDELGFEFSPYDDLRMERGQTKNICEIGENLEEDDNFTEEQMELLKELFLQAGYTKYTFDW